MNCNITSALSILNAALSTAGVSGSLTIELGVPSVDVGLPFGFVTGSYEVRGNAADQGGEASTTQGVAAEQSAVAAVAQTATAVQTAAATTVVDADYLIGKYVLIKHGGRSSAGMTCTDTEVYLTYDDADDAGGSDDIVAEIVRHGADGYINLYRTDDTASSGAVQGAKVGRDVHSTLEKATRYATSSTLLATVGIEW